MPNESLIKERVELMDKFPITDMLSCLHTLDINTTELCNRTCEFCPRHNNQYPNQNLHMSLETAKILTRHLADIQYTNQIHFGGQSEPLLTQNFSDIVRTLKDGIPSNNNFHLTTNGDRLTDRTIIELIDAGINHINVSCYDGPDQEKKFIELLQGKISFTIKRFWLTQDQNWGLPAISNRAGKLFFVENQVQMKCNLPFYSCAVDWNGNIYLCVHDWVKQKIFGNIHYTSLKEIWLSEMLNEHRKMLMDNKRSCGPCKGCNVAGDFYGERNFQLFKEFL